MSGRNKREQDELGPNSAGQSGDIQHMSDAADADSDSLEELAEEGNAFEADAMQGVESAKVSDASEVITRKVPEDHISAEYLRVISP